MSILDQAGLPLTAAVAVLTLITTARREFALALGILLAGASLSGITATVGGVGIRIEQPAVILLAGLLVVRQRDVVGSVARDARWPIAFALVYLAANIGSALLFAPDRLQSLKITLWLSISLLAALVAAVLAMSAPLRFVHRQVVRWVVGAACLHAAVAAVQVVAEIVLGSDWGVLRSDVSIGKAFGLAWEPNLLAIQLAAASMFVLDPASRQYISPRARHVALLMISAGMALSLSRGGIVAGIGGIAILVIATARHRAWSTSRARLIIRDGFIVATLAVSGYVALSWLAARGVGLRPGEVTARAEQPQGTLVPIELRSPAEPGATSGPTAVPGSNRPSQSAITASPYPSPSPSPASEGRYLGAGDTIELRVRNLQIAVADGLTSPMLGLGPDTFGQRYVEPTCTCPAHIPNQLSATFYESGVVGLASLFFVLAWVIVRGLQRRLDVYVASLATLLIGFQFTDALRFGATWLLIGVMIGLIIRSDGEAWPGDPERAGTP